MQRDLLEHGHKLCSAQTNLDYQIIFGRIVRITLVEIFITKEPGLWGEVFWEK